MLLQRMHPAPVRASSSNVRSAAILPSGNAGHGLVLARTQHVDPRELNRRALLSEEKKPQCYMV